MSKHSECCVLVASLMHSLIQFVSVLDSYCRVQHYALSVYRLWPGPTHKTKTFTCENVGLCFFYSIQQGKEGVSFSLVVSFEKKIKSEVF